MASSPRGIGPQALQWRVVLSGLVMLLERILRTFWPCGVLLLFGLAAGLFGILPPLGATLHSVVLVAFGIAFVLLLARGARKWQMPHWRQARARLDRGTLERPAATLADRQIIGTGDSFSERVWHLHRKRAAIAAKELAVSGPELDLAARDPWALRAAAMLLVLAGGVYAGAEWWQRVYDAAVPNFTEVSGTAIAPPELEVWTEPPAYTGVPPIYLTDRPADSPPLELPVGTVFEVRVYGATEAPVLHHQLPDRESERERALEVDGEQAYALSLPLTDGGDLRLRLGEVLMGEWEVGIVPDLPPTIDFTSPPQRTEAGALTFSYRVSDDYGAVRAWAVVTPTSEISGRTRLMQLAPIEIPLALPFVFAGESEEFVIRDLTAHPWAGSGVAATLYVEDDIEQLGQSQVHRFILPAREFTEPMAKTFVEQRRNLAYAESVNAAGYSHATLTAAMRHPDDYFDDPVAYLSSRIGVERLASMIWSDTEWSELPGVLELLWRSARRLEDGTLGDATDQLRNAIRALEDALARNASDEELARLMQELRQAINEYLTAMRDNAMEDPNAQMADGEMFDTNALNDMLESLEGNARLGQREQARQMLAGLRSMLENLRMGAAPNSGGLGELGELVEDQIDLADDTLQTGRALTDSQSDSLSDEVLDPETLAAMQNELRQRLDELREQLLGGEQNGMPPPGGGQPMPGAGAQPGPGTGQQGQAGQDGQPVPGEGGQPGAPGPDGSGPGTGTARQRLDQAGAAMGRAQQQLEGGNAAGALDSQLEAAEAMRAAGRELSAGDQGPAVGVMPGQGQGLRDPFGRFDGQGSPIGDVMVPDAGGLQRVKQLFDEIRQRAGERSRPETERGYLERLIDRF